MHCRIVLTGPLAGKTMHANGVQFSNGEANIEMPDPWFAGFATYFQKCYQAEVYRDGQLQVPSDQSAGHAGQDLPGGGQPNGGASSEGPADSRVADAGDASGHGSGAAGCGSERPATVVSRSKKI